MISDSMEKSCLRIDVSGAEDGIDCRLHLPTFCHLVHRWHVHNAISIQRPWISCCGDIGNNRESVGDGGGTVSGGNALTSAIIESPSVTAVTAAALSVVATVVASALVASGSKSSKRSFFLA